MPSENTKKDATKIIALVAGFLFLALVAILVYTQVSFKGDELTENKTSQETTNSPDELTTYTSKNHGFSISYPKSWTKSTGATSGQAGNAEIILLNLTDRETRNNGKPNMIIYAGSPIDFCDSTEAPICKEETLTVSGLTIKKYNNIQTKDIFYDMGEGVFIFATANGDQETIDKVINTYKRS